MAETPRRIIVNGVSGSGKTTLAAQLARRLDIPHVEIDGLHHGAGWKQRPEFLDDVRALVRQEAWVTEYQYADARPLLLERADLVVWLDLPRWLSLWQVVRRTLRRRWRREVLWNGNVEQPLWRILVDREHIIRWAWTSWPAVAERIEEVRRTRPGLPVVRLRSRREVRAWLRIVGTPGRPR
ncbi:MAG TPA: AAA family ATPase [Marmoricola sp.]|nr:AAA family ATPase [Marmoricola sp.]